MNGWLTLAFRQVEDLQVEVACTGRHTPLPAPAQQYTAACRPTGAQLIAMQHAYASSKQHTRRCILQCLDCSRHSQVQRT